MKNIKLSMMSAVMALLILATSCNKDLEQFSDPIVAPATGQTLDQVLKNNADDSLFYKMAGRIGLNAVLADSTKAHTLFVTSNAGLKPVLSAIAAQGGVTLPVGAPDAAFSAFISQMPLTVIGGLISYNAVPQKLKSTDIGVGFPNFIYPTILNPAPSNQTLLGPIVRLALYPSVSNGAWLNNVPITGVDQMASNGVIHHTYTMATPSQRYLWDRISSDPQLTYLKAAIQRADSGSAPAASLQGYLSSFGPDFTIFAPVDTAFKSALTALIAQGLINSGVPAMMAVPLATQLASTPDVFTNPLLVGTLTPQTVKGILVYHVLGKRAYTNNFPVAETSVPTLLNSVLSAHPGLKIKAVFGGPLPMNPFATAATVKDVYNNSPAAKIIINASPLTPDPYGTSDQGFVNGVLHKIDRLLLPQ